MLILASSQHCHLQDHYQCLSIFYGDKSAWTVKTRKKLKNFSHPSSPSLLWGPRTIIIRSRARIIRGGEAMAGVPKTWRTPSNKEAKSSPMVLKSSPMLFITIADTFQIVADTFQKHRRHFSRASASNSEVSPILLLPYGRGRALPTDATLHAHGTCAHTLYI